MNPKSGEQSDEPKRRIGRFLKSTFFGRRWVIGGVRQRKRKSMGERMIGIRVSIARYISDDPQPGIVECNFLDAHGKQHQFVEKTAVVSYADIDAQSTYPRPGVIACVILDRYRDVLDRELVVVETEEPWGVESTEGAVRFSVYPSALIEWNWGSHIESQWNGII